MARHAQPATAGLPRTPPCVSRAFRCCGTPNHTGCRQRHHLHGQAATARTTRPQPKATGHPAVPVPAQAPPAEPPTGVRISAELNDIEIQITQLPPSAAGWRVIWDRAGRDEYVSEHKAGLGEGAEGQCEATACARRRPLSRLVAMAHITRTAVAASSAPLPVRG